MKHFESIHWSAEAAPEVFYKKRVFKNFAQENTYARVSF